MFRPTPPAAAASAVSPILSVFPPPSRFLVRLSGAIRNAARSVRGFLGRRPAGLTAGTVDHSSEFSLSPTAPDLASLLTSSLPGLVFSHEEEGEKGEEDLSEATAAEDSFITVVEDDKGAAIVTHALKPLAVGGSAFVYQGTFGDMPCAVKIAKNQKKNGTVQSEINFFREFEKTRAYDSTFFMKMLYSFITDEGFNAFCLEFCNKGDLLTFINQSLKDFSMQERLEVLIQVASGIAYLHNDNIIHRDLKLDNVLIHEGTNGSLQPKISDFGLSKFVKAEEVIQGYQSRNRVGTRQYQSYEVDVAKGELATYSERSDGFGFGVMVGAACILSTDNETDFNDFEVLAAMTQGLSKVEKEIMTEVVLPICFCNEETMDTSPKGLALPKRISFLQQDKTQPSLANQVGQSLERIWRKEAAKDLKESKKKLSPPSVDASGKASLTRSGFSLRSVTC